MVELEEETAQAEPPQVQGHGMGDAPAGEAQVLRELVETLRSQVQGQGEELDLGTEAGGLRTPHPPSAKGAPGPGRSPVVAALMAPHHHGQTMKCIRSAVMAECATHEGRAKVDKRQISARGIRR
jgi:hypothetical protein